MVEKPSISVSRISDTLSEYFGLIRTTNLKIIPDIFFSYFTSRTIKKVRNMIMEKPNIKEGFSHTISLYKSPEYR